MGPAGQQRVGWVGRTFGWSNTRDAWLGRLGVVAWAAGLYVILSNSGGLTTGEAVLAVGGWFLLLAIVARQAVRDMFGPVFFYEVVRVGRKSLTFRLRFFYVVLVSGLLVLMYVAWLEDIGYFKPNRRVDLIQTQALSRFANGFFEVFVVVQYMTVILLTPVYVAGAIAVEKERKTLEFLLATDLRNREIVFGKLAARLTNLIMYVLAGLPIVAVLQLFGGIDPNLLVAAFAATVINVIGVAAVAVYMSTMMRRARDAIVLTYLLTIVYALGSFLLAGLAVAPFGGVWWQQTVTAFGYSFSVADFMLASADGNVLWKVPVLLLGVPGPGPAVRVDVTDTFREFATFWGIVTVVAIGLSVWRLRSVALAQSYGAVRGPRKKKTAGGRPARRFPEVGDNPVFWREVFVEGGVRGGWLWRVIIAVVLLLIFVPVVLIVYETFVWRPGRWGGGWTMSATWYEFGRAMNSWCRMATGIVATLMFFAAAVRGAGAVSGEKDRDTYISLIGTPLSADGILWGKWWGCILGLRRPFLVLTVIWALGLAVGAVHPVSLLYAIPTLLVLVSAFSWAGLFCSMRARNSLNASIQAFFLTLFLAGGFWAALGMLCGLPLAILEVKGQIVDDLIQVALGFTPSVMASWSVFRSAEKRDMDPFGFEFDEGLGFVSLILGLCMWVGVNALFASICLWQFRRMTNRVPVYLPEELQLREEFARSARPARPLARPVPLNGTPADPPTLDERQLSAPDAEHDGRG